MSKRKLTYKDFKNYFSNNLQNKDKHAFEKQMMQDAFEEEAFDGLSQLSEAEMGQDIAELKSNISYLTKKTRRIVPVWFKYAASVIILVGIGLSIFFMNSRFWQDSMLKEQLSYEMGIADSIIIDAAEEIPITRQDAFEGSDVKDLVADNKPVQRKEKQDQSKPIQVVEDDVVIEEELILDDAEKEIDAYEAIEIIEFEEEEEMVDEADLFMIVSEPEYDEEKLNKGTVEKMKAAEIEIKESVESAPNIRLRGSAALSKPSKKSNSEFIVDGVKFDPDNTKTIKGKVLSSKEQLLIDGVSIVLNELPAFETTTDQNGEFVLTIPNDDRLKTLIISFVGLKSQVIKMDNDSSLIVYLDPEKMLMEDIGADYIYELEERNDVAKVRIYAIPPNSLSIKKYEKQIEENLDYSKFKEFPGKYKIKASFTVNKDGTLGNFSFKNVPDKVFSDEIIRVMKETGDRIPQKNDERNVSSTIKLTLKIDVKE